MTPPVITGASLTNAIRRRARELGEPLHRFAAPLSNNVETWLHQLEQAQRPKPHTIARVQALLAGEPVPPPPTNSLQNRAQLRAGPRVVPVAGRNPDPADVPSPIHREPCFRCGIRADIGCKHQRND